MASTTRGTADIARRFNLSDEEAEALSRIAARDERPVHFVVREAIRSLIRRREGSNNK